MRFQWIVSILSNLVSMGLLIVVMGQYQLLSMQSRSEEKLKTETQRLANLYMNEDLVKGTMEKLLAGDNTAVTELEAALAKLNPELEKAKQDVDACQAEKNTNTDDLTVSLKEHTETEASLKAVSDAWNQEINILKGQLTEYRSICDHVKKVPLVMKLCGPKPS